VARYLNEPSRASSSSNEPSRAGSISSPNPKLSKQIRVKVANIPELRPSAPACQLQQSSTSPLTASPADLRVVPDSLSSCVPCLRAAPQLLRAAPHSPADLCAAPHPSEFHRQFLVVLRNMLLQCCSHLAHAKCSSRASA
jgi:hypothetical protein